MRNHIRSSHRSFVDEAHFEPKARELIAPDEEIEAWELDPRDPDCLGNARDFFGAAGSE
jgi:hypothetical protein